MLGIGLALAAAMAATAVRVQQRENRAEASHPPTGQFLTVDGHQVHVLEMGQPQGSAPDLVLIHGASGSTRDMTFRLAPALAADYRILIVDRPGLGYTSRINETGATIRQQAALLKEAVQALGARQPVVLGHSYGGAVALSWAVDHPGSLSALVNVSGPSHPWTTPLDPFYRITSSALGRALVVPALTAYVPQAAVERALAGVFAPQAVPEGYAEHFGPGLTLRRKTLRANALQRANLLAEIEALAPHYHALSLPVEIVHGSADTTVGAPLHAEKLLRDVPQARLTLLDGIGHMPHHTATGEVVAAVHRAAARAGLR
ncbi:alpha/beta fold hydrolase [Roseobacteraceae bacterium NS-SX3]